MIHWIAEKLGLHKCPQCETLVDYAMDGLEPGQVGKVRKHLSECPPCMEQVRDFLQVKEGLGMAVPMEDCPKDFNAKVLARLQAEESGAPSVKSAPVALDGWPMFWMRLGPVFAVTSLLMTFVALAAVWHGGASSSTSSELAQATEALLKDPNALHVALVGSQASGELVLCRGKRNIYLQADKLSACKRGRNYVLWMQPQDQPQAQRVAGFMVEADGKHFQLLQLPQGLEAKGPVKFMVTQEDTLAKDGASKSEWLAGTVSL